MIYTGPLGAVTNSPQRVAAYLAAKGYVLTDGVSLHGDGSITVECDRDPTADLAAYVDAPTPKEQRVVTAKQAVALYVAAVAAIPAAARTPEQRCLSALLSLLEGIGGL